MALHPKPLCPNAPPNMTAKTHFDRGIDEEQSKVVQSAMKITPNAVELAELQGRWRGLELARDVFRKAAREDIHE